MTLLELQSIVMSNAEVTDLIRSSAAFRNDLSYLAKIYLRQEVSGCNTCYFDAYVKLMLKNPMEQPKKLLFDMPAGKLIKDIKGTRLTISRANITNELALYHIKTNPICISRFSKVPANLKDLLARFDTETMTLKDEKIKVTPTEKTDLVEEKEIKTTAPKERGAK